MRASVTASLWLLVGIAATGTAAAPQALHCTNLTLDTLFPAPVLHVRVFEREATSTHRGVATIPNRVRQLGAAVCNITHRVASYIGQPADRYNVAPSPPCTSKWEVCSRVAGPGVAGSYTLFIREEYESLPQALADPPNDGRAGAHDVSAIEHWIGKVRGFGGGVSASHHHHWHHYHHHRYKRQAAISPFRRLAPRHHATTHPRHHATTPPRHPQHPNHATSCSMNQISHAPFVGRVVGSFSVPYGFSDLAAVESARVAPGTASAPPPTPPLPEAGNGRADECVGGSGRPYHRFQRVYTYGDSQVRGRQLPATLISLFTMHHHHSRPPHTAAHRRAPSCVSAPTAAFSDRKTIGDDDEDVSKVRLVPRRQVHSSRGRSQVSLYLVKILVPTQWATERFGGYDRQSNSLQSNKTNNNNMQENIILVCVDLITQINGPGVHRMASFVKEVLAHEKKHHEGRVALVFNAAEVSQCITLNS